MRYFLYIPLPARLSKRIAAIGKRYRGNPYSDPHITIVNPRTILTGRSERELLRALRASAATLSPCRISYDGVAYFGSKDFVYVPVRRTPALRSCHRACVRAVKGILAAGQPHFFLRPHITLAGRLAPEDGDRVWQVLRRKRFEGQFWCRDIVLLRKGAADTRWRPVSRFRLGGER